MAKHVFDLIKLFHYEIEVGLQTDNNNPGVLRE